MAVLLLLSKASTAQYCEGCECLVQFHEQAGALYDAKAYKQAISLYECANKSARFPFSKDDHYSAACFYALDGRPGDALAVMNLLLDQYHYRDDQVLQDSDFIPCRRLPEWQVMEHRVTSARDSVGELAKGYRALKDTLIAIGNRDQSVRQVVADPELFGKLTSFQRDSVYRAMDIQDSLDLIMVSSIIDRHGWVDAALIGDSASTAMWLVIQHTPEVMDRYFPLLRQAALNGAAKPYQMAWMEDRMLVTNEKKPQKYGSQLLGVLKEKAGLKPGIVYMAEVDDPSHLDCRRISIGVQPIQTTSGQDMPVSITIAQYHEALKK